MHILQNEVPQSLSLKASAPQSLSFSLSLSVRCVGVAVLMHACAVLQQQRHTLLRKNLTEEQLVNHMTQVPHCSHTYIFLLPLKSLLALYQYN